MPAKSTTALFFGSFNPVHVGHLLIADYFAQQLGETWMVLSPHNPHKDRRTLAGDYDRLALLELGIGDNERVKASQVEFKLPKPSYTVDTLTHLRERYPTRSFALIMGGDNLLSFERWRNPHQILAHHELHVYVRPDYEVAGRFAEHPQVHLHQDVPQMHLSSSLIRRRLAAGESVRYLTPEPVRLEMEARGMYR